MREGAPGPKLQRTNPARAQDLIARAAKGEKVSAVEPSTAAQEFAEWIADHSESNEIPMIITWLQQVSAKGVVAALQEIRKCQ
jgi:hypothetical protein